MDPNFCIRQVIPTDSNAMKGFWIESTAPLNVDDKAGMPPSPDSMGGVHFDQTMQPPTDIETMAQALEEGDEPELVVLVHGFNNPGNDPISRYASAYKAVNADPTLAGRRGLVFCGYHWPSEGMGTTLASSWRAMPGALFGILALSLVMFIFSIFSFYLTRFSDIVPVQIGLGLVGVAALILAVFPIRPGKFSAKAALGVAAFFVAIGIIVTLWLIPQSTVEMVLRFAPAWAFAVLAIILTSFWAILTVLRLTVYFRDNYRAANYGALDLVEVIRQLDKQINRDWETKGRPDGAAGRIKLSFIGHSMGAFVVTNAVRILSDVFDDASIPNRAVDAQPEPGPEVGRVFVLNRLVLVSPDIPAEALLTQRANFLLSSLHRFNEAILVSNMADVVLRMVSTMANFFTFPTRSREHGFRLGNTQVVSKEYGVITPPEGPGTDKQFLRMLRVGARDLDHLEEVTATSGPSAAPMARRFTYFDCTDYEENGRAYVSRSKKVEKLTAFNNWSLLLSYIGLWPGYVDVHSGYFSGPFSSKMIYRLACSGIVGLSQPIDATSAKSAYDSLGDMYIRALIPSARQHRIAMAAAAAAAPGEPESLDIDRAVVEKPGDTASIEDKPATQKP